MKTINWERDSTGAAACTKLPKPARFVSASAAAAIAKSLMHEVTTISASFEPEDIVVFSRLAGISVFGEKDAEYFGLYASSGAAAGVNYCLRRCTWQRAFRSTEDVLKGLSAQTFFFDVERLGPFHRAVVLAVDEDHKDGFQLVPEPSSNGDFSGKQISYIVSDDRKELAATYRAESSTNPAIEKLFKELQAMFGSLEVEGTVNPLPDSLRISYSFFSLAESLGLAS